MDELMRNYTNVTTQSLRDAVPVLRAELLTWFKRDSFDRGPAIDNLFALITEYELVISVRTTEELTRRHFNKYPKES